MRGIHPAMSGWTDIFHVVVTFQKINIFIYICWKSGIWPNPFVLNFVESINSSACNTIQHHWNLQWMWKSFAYTEELYTDHQISLFRYLYIDRCCETEMILSNISKPSCRKNITKLSHRQNPETCSQICFYVCIYFYDNVFLKKGCSPEFSAKYCQNYSTQI